MSEDNLVFVAPICKYCNMKVPSTTLVMVQELNGGFAAAHVCCLADVNKEGPLVVQQILVEVQKMYEDRIRRLEAMVSIQGPKTGE